MKNPLLFVVSTLRSRHQLLIFKAFRYFVWVTSKLNQTTHLFVIPACPESIPGTPPVGGLRE
ncbi:hypothetical protein ISS30_08035 [bacterium]|nr:hypothetical protein [bacterium]